MKKTDRVHEKAIRLVEGGEVEIDGHSVRLVKYPCLVDPCFCCEMDSLCHIGNEMCSVCEECDAITKLDCLLTLVETKRQRR